MSIKGSGITANIKLSICISTRNRAGFIGATLESIISQATSECEIVVFDGASTDDTERVVCGYRSRFDQIRYYKQENNDGAERGFDHAIELARGEYCWLFSDDDLLRPGAVEAVLGAIRKGYSLIVVNVEYVSFDMSRVLRSNLRDIDVQVDRQFGPEDIEGLFEATWKLVRYLGSVVIEREIWRTREKERYFGSYWAVVGVIFQKPLPRPALVLAKPYISVRMENQSWLRHYFSIYCVHWPALVASLALSDRLKNQCVTKVWESPMFLIRSRAAGQYSLEEYRQHVRPRLPSLRRRMLAAFIAVCPGVALNIVLVSYYCVFKPDHARSWLAMLSQGQFNLRSRHHILEASNSSQTP
jgi:glycosyltransferase involved in cell wall biosynthesis